MMSAPGDSLASSDLELLWKFRHALTGEKKALPKFLLAVDWRDASEVAQVPALLKQWTRIDVADAIKLLGPDQAYQRRVVRAFAVDALRAASDMELVTYLLQLVQALRYDEKDEKGRSPLASFLSERAAKSLCPASFLRPRPRSIDATIPRRRGSSELRVVVFEGRSGRRHRRAVLCYISRVSGCAEIKFYGAFALNLRVDLHAIDATPARWRGDAGCTRRTG